MGFSGTWRFELYLCRCTPCAPRSWVLSAKMFRPGWSRCWRCSSAGFSRDCWPGRRSINFISNCGNVFQLLASERYSRIEERFEDQEQRLDGLRRFFVNSESVSREEFDGYAKPLLHRTQAYSWAPRVSHTERPLLERVVREEGLSGFTFRELTADGQLQPATERDEYVPVLYTQTQSRLPTPLGYDLLAQALRRSTLERADRNGRMVVSQPLHLVGIEPAYSRGVLLVAPVIRQNLASAAPAGYVMAVISMRQLLADGLPEENHDSLSVRILDLSTDDQHEVLYESTNTAGGPVTCLPRVCSVWPTMIIKWICAPAPRS